MFLYVDVTIDQPPGKARGRKVANWFEAMESAFFMDSTSPDSRWGAGLTQVDGDDTVYFGSRAVDREAFMGRLLDDPFWVQSFLASERDDDTSARVRTYPTIFNDPRFVSLSAVVPCSDPEGGDVEFCSKISRVAEQACEELNPTFGRIEFDLAEEKTNLDIGLRRKLKTSVLEAREVLRGYSWWTIVPEEMASQIGGAAYFESREAFCRVHELSRGGLVAQVTPTVKEYDDDAMGRNFSAVAPLLPPGRPSVHVAFPDVRFVIEDAATVGE